MNDNESVSPFLAGLTCKCPRCGNGLLFTGFLTIRDRCSNCGLDFSFADAGDGPAVFIMLIVGFIVTGGALLLEVFYSPPYWVHAIIWLPLSIILPLAILRPLKALLVALQYTNKAELGRIDD